jgi:hypothetical protein
MIAFVASARPEQARIRAPGWPGTWRGSGGRFFHGRAWSGVGGRLLGQFLAQGLEVAGMHADACQVLGHAPIPVVHAREHLEHELGW